MGTAATASSAVARRTASPSPSPSSSVLPPIRRRAASAMEMARGGEPEPEPEPRQRTGVGACPGPGVERLIEMAMGDVAPDLRPALQAVPCVRQAVVLQCVYYAHMFFVLRERAIKRRIRLEKKRKRTLSATFAGAEERQVQPETPAYPWATFTHRRAWCDVAVGRGARCAVAVALRRTRTWPSARR
jgi:hypothetical protein